MNIISSFIKRLRTDSYYRNALIYTCASLITSALNYVYYPILARLVSVEEFGELQLVISLLLQLATVFNGLNLISISLVTNNNVSVGRKLITALQKVIVWVFFAIFLVVIAASPLLAGYFHFNSPLPFALIAPALLISAVSIFWTAYLQAKEDFAALSVYNITTALAKIIASVILVLVGYRVAGAVLGVSIGLAVALFVLSRSTKHILPPIKDTLAPPSPKELLIVKKHTLFIGSVIVSLVTMSILLSVDTMIVKRLFSPELAGNYAGVSTIARIIFFATAPLVGIMLPAIRLGNDRESNHAFWQTLKLSLVVCLGGLALFTLFPVFFTTLLLGEKFAGAASYLPLLAVLASLSALLNIQLNYTLALRDTIGVFLIATATVSSLVLTLAFHADVYQIIASLSMALVATQLVFWIYYYRKRRSKYYATSS